MDISDTAVTEARGGCLCGAVRYQVSGPLRPSVACHCEQCRRTSGHYVSATACRQRDLTFDEDRGLAWYRSSDFAERGFCRECGSSLFYRRTNVTPEEQRISIMSGTLDTPTGLSTAGHIFCAAKSDYYEIADDTPHLSIGYDSAPYD